MAQYFFDTSAIVKHYHQESGTDAVEAILASSGCVARISALGAVEIHSALAVKARGGFLAATEARALSGLVLRDISSGMIRPHAITQSHLSASEELIFSFGYEHRLRSLDAIQLAVASDLRTHGLVDFVVTADIVLQQVAAMMGFAVINPQHA